MSCLYSRFLRTPLCSQRLLPVKTYNLGRCTFARSFSSNTMSDLFVELTAPNGRKYKQPRGLFINNEFVASKSGETITSINPR